MDAQAISRLLILHVKPSVSRHGWLRSRLLLIPLIILIVFAFIFMGNSLSLIPWVMSGCIVVFACLLARRVLRTSLDLLTVGILAYLFLSIVGLILINIYRRMYQLDFGPYGDDSRYYNNISDIANAVKFTGFTGYEFLMALWYQLVALFVGTPGNLDLLPFNWAFGALVTVFSYQLAYEVGGYRLPIWLLLVALVGNAIFSDTVTNLYRDGPMLVMMLISMIATVRGKYGMAVIAAFCCAFIRGANGILAIFFLMLVLMARNKLFKHNLVMAVIIMVIGGTSFIALASSMNIGRLFRTWTPTSSEQSMPEQSLSDRLTSRQGWLSGGSENKTSSGGSGGGDTTQSLYNSGVFGLAMMPIASCFAPIRFSPLITEMEMHIYAGRQKLEIRALAVRPQSPFEWLTIPFWVLLGPLIILGIYFGFKGTPVQRYFMLYFIIVLLGVTFVSFQVRHRTAFIVLFPTLIAIASAVPPRYRRFEPVLRILFVLLIVAMNLMRAL